MQQQNVPPTAAQSEAPVTQKLPYSPPKAAFVPLYLEDIMTAGPKKKSFLSFGCC